MKQVVLDYRGGEVLLVNVPVPLVHRGGLLVRNRCSAASLGTEVLMADMAKKNLLGKARARPDPVRQLLADPEAYGPISQASNPYGDGRAAKRIVSILESPLAQKR